MGRKTSLLPPFTQLDVLQEPMAEAPMELWKGRVKDDGGRGVHQTGNE